MKGLPDQLSPQLAGHFTVAGLLPGRVVLPPGQGEVDLRTISLARARELVAAGFPYLQAVPPDVAPATPPKKRKARRA